MSVALKADVAVNFHDEVFPILENRCFRCHSSEKQKGDLRLDSPIWIMQGGESGDVLVPGEPDQSPMYYMTTYPKDDPDYMPSKGEGLSESEQELLRRWIVEGATFGDAMAAVAMDGQSGELPATSKYSDDVPLPPAVYDFSVSVIGLIRSLEELGLLVDSVNHDAERFELTYTYADSIEAYDLSKLDPISDAVVKLNYGRSAVGDDQLQGISSLRALSYLDLRRTAVSDLGLKHLSGLDSLEYLNLFETNIGDEGLSYLRNLKGLKQLYLHGTRVTPAGIQSIRAALPQLEIVL